MIIDTDIGTYLDDTLAVLFAAQSPQVKVEAVTMVYGDIARGDVLNGNPVDVLRTVEVGLAQIEFDDPQSQDWLDIDGTR